MSKNKSSLRWIGLQFFADEPDSGNDNNQAKNDTQQKNEPDTTGSNQQQKNEPVEKTFTQEDVNRMLANEKRQGRQAALKALGLDPNDKDAEKKAKEILDAQKSDAEKVAEALKAAQEAQAEALKKATAAEYKLGVLNAGCKKDYVDEVMALASAKVDESTTFEMALKAIKEKCAAFFEGNDPGTGGGQGHRKNDKKDKPGSFGTRLAQNVVNSNTKKNPYFTN